MVKLALYVVVETLGPVLSALEFVVDDSEFFLADLFQQFVSFSC